MKFLRICLWQPLVASLFLSLNTIPALAKKPITLSCYHSGWNIHIYFTINFDRRTIYVLNENNNYEFSITSYDDSYINGQRATEYNSFIRGTNTKLDREISLIKINRLTGQMTGQKAYDGPSLRREKKWLGPEPYPYYNMPCSETEPLKPKF